MPRDMAAHRGEADVQLLAEPGDLGRFLGDLLLPPDAGDGAGDGDEVGRRGEQHAALERPFPEAVVLLERGGQEMLAGNVHDDIIGGVAELAPSNSWSRAAGRGCGSRRRAP